MISKINNNKKMITLFLMCLGGMAMAHTSIPIKDVEVLTLQADKMTTGRRASPVLQQVCTGPRYLCKNRPETIQCSNTGWDGLDANWECKGELENGVKFGKLNVQCEGYEYPDDPNILAGSCGLEYTLYTTSDYIRTDYKSTSDDEGGSFLGFLVIMLIFFGFISCLCDTCDSSNHGRYNHRRYSSSGNDFWTGAAAGYSVGRSSGGGWGGSSEWGSSRSSGWGGGSSISSGFATTSRR